MQTNDILALEQFGFRKGSHIEKVIFTLTDSILTSLNQHEQVGGIFCDLTKAFDCVNHESLLAKLHYYGIRGVNANWFKTCITNRKQKVKITSQSHRGDSLCRWETIKDGVPQGSILGPLLFIIYVNCLPSVIHQFARPVIYADDTSILVTAKNLKDLQIKVSSTLNHVSNGFSSNGLTLNTEKTNIIKFYSNHFHNNLQQSASKINTIK
jgi:hypothetical protein